MEVDRLLIAVSETCGVIVTIPAQNTERRPTAFEFLVTSEDRIKSVSLYIGQGVK